MFRSVKLKNMRLTMFSLICLVIFVAVCLLMLRAGAPDTVTVGGESYSLRAENEDDIKAFVRVCGYETGDPVSDTGITVPKHWNDTYTNYNRLQREQGFDLVPYKGKPARELIYALPDGGEYITLLVSDGKIIAAHICDADGQNMRTLIESL